MKLTNRRGFRPAFLRLALSILLIGLTAGSALAQQRQMIDINARLLPWKTHYESRDNWPRSCGWKPYMRYQWDMLQRTYPDGQVPAGALWEAYQQRQQMRRHPLDETWTNIGPFNHGGRARVLRFYPDNPTIMYAGAVSGGLWRSDDAGENWYPITDDLPNLAVGSFEFDLTNPQIMYLGTGEGYFNGDAVAGIGLLKSTDGGETWNTTGLAYPYSQGESVLQIDIDPRNGDIVLASTNDGLYRSTNGAVSFSMVRSGNIQELKRDPLNPNVLLCSSGGWSGGRLYRSTDNGFSWTAISEGLPSLSEFGRAVIDFYQANPNIVYAGIASTSNWGTLGIFRSTDNGLSWNQMSQPGTNHYASQGWYDIGLAVKPDNSAIVLSAGLDVYRSTNSGFHWSQRSYWWEDFGRPDYVHADQHEIVFHPSNPEEVWIVCDGGIFKSTDAGLNWEEKNNGFATFQFYAMGNSTLSLEQAYGGTQDNGTFRWRGNPSWSAIYGGDGAYCVVDYTDDNTVYVEYQNGNRYRSDDFCQTWSSINSGIDGNGAWVTPMMLDPFDHMTLYTTTSSPSRFWKSTNQGRAGSWQPLGQQLNGDMQVIDASPLVPDLLYVGTSSTVYRYNQENNEWENISRNLPGRWVTRVVADRFNAEGAYVTLSGFGGSHVWKLTEADGNWEDITGNLPNVPFQDVIQDPVELLTLYAGGDIGVYCTTDGGATWEIFGEGLPVARVDDMDLQPLNGMLRAATHGRGMWEIPTNSSPLAWIYPNGGEMLAIGDEVELHWGGLALHGNVTIDVNRDYPSGNWETLFADIPIEGGSAAWTVTGPETDHVRFRIQHTTIPGQSDTSDADAAIRVPGLDLVWPDGGELVLAGVFDTVRFVRTLVPEMLRAELNRSYPDGAWELIEENVSGSDWARWRVMMPGGEHCRIRVSSMDRPEISCESGADFTLRSPVMDVLAPDGGETVYIGTPYLVQWTAEEHEGNILIYLNRDYPEGNWELQGSWRPNSGSSNWVPDGQPSANCRIRVSTIYDATGSFAVSESDFELLTLSADAACGIPDNYRLSPPYPNPFNPSTRFVMELPERTPVSAVVFNRLGQEVATLVSDVLNPGRHSITFDAAGLPSGVYFIRVSAFEETEVLKAVLLR